jgi:transposase InsO family protein
VIERNRHKYSVSAMCGVLQITRSTFYYETKIAVKKEQEKAAEEQKLKEEIQMIFNKNRQVYGTRKIKNGNTVSRRSIGRLMGELGIQSKYAQASYKPMTSPPNEEAVQNVLQREFQVYEEMSVFQLLDLCQSRSGLELRLFFNRLI